MHYVHPLNVIFLDFFPLTGKEETTGSYWHIYSRTNWSRCTSNLHHGAEEDSWWRCYSYIWLV